MEHWSVKKKTVAIKATGSELFTNIAKKLSSSASTECQTKD